MGRREDTMRKRFLRKIAAALAAIMVISNLSPLAAVVSAAETTADLSQAGTYVFDAADLEVAGAWGATVDTTDGKYDVKFSKQYDQLFLKIPEGITADRIQSVSVDADAANFSLKFCDNDPSKYNELAVVYGNTTITAADIKADADVNDITVLGIMNLLDGEATKSIGKISFTLSAKTVEQAPEETPEEAAKTVVTDAAGVYSFDAADLEVAANWGVTVDTADGKYDVTFPKQYSQIFYKFPEGVTADRIKSVSVDADPVEFCVKLSVNRDNFLAGAERFGATTVTLDKLADGVSLDEVCIVGLMSTLDGEAVKSIGKISFDLSEKKAAEQPGEEPAPETPSEGVLAPGSYVYKPQDLTRLAAWDTQVVDGENGAITATFAKQYSQLFFAVPEDIIPARIEEVIVDTDSANFSVKLCKKDGSYTEVGVVYGNTKLTLSNVSGDIAEAEVLDLMSLLDGELVKTIKSVTFVIGEDVVIDPNAPKKGDLTLDCFKDAANGNPIVTQRYSADPGVMVYGDTVYVYSTNDVYEYNKKNQLGENTYSKITTINCFSSKDLVNWTDHGAIAVAGKQNPEGPAKWANNSWAPCAAHKTIDGKEKFFLYFADNGSGIGVLTSDTPYGPFVDPIGRQLVSRQTPTCASVEWLFDPAVLVDDDGTGYLYFGGGVPNGKAADPGTARVVKLGDDMISLAGDPVQINPPYLFEDSGINKIGNKYYYTYCSNWNCADGFRSGTIQAMVSDNPMGPFTYQGEIFANPSSFFNDGNGNNHHSLFEFNGKLYLAYHARALERKAVGSALGYRTTQIDEVTVTDGKINAITATMKGVAQLTTVNPYEVQSAATIYRQKGIEVLGSGNPAVTVTEGDFTGVKGVNFDSGVSTITMTVKASEAMTIDVLAGGEKGTKLGTVEVAATNGEFSAFKADLASVSGVNDLYFVFNGSAEVATWKAEASVYTLDDLKSAGGYGFELVKDATGKTIAIDYKDQYQEARFAIPESVLKAGLEKVVVFTEDASNLSIKTLDASGAQIEVSYGSSELAVTKTEGLASIALMNKGEGAQTIYVSGVKFITPEIEVPVEPETPAEEEKPSALTGKVVLNASDLDVYYRWNASTKAENGVMKFPSNYYEYCVALPEAINVEDIESIVVNVADQTGSLAIKVYSTAETGNGDLDNSTPCHFNMTGKDSYSVPVPEEGVVAALGFMSHADDAPFEATIKSIEITVKTKAIILGADELSNLVNPWNASDVKGPSINFTGRYQEYGYTFDEAIPTNSIESVVVKVKDQGGNICVKFYDEAGTEWYHNYGVDGNTEYTFVPEADKDIKKIAFMSMLDPEVAGNYPYGITIESVTVNLKAGASSTNKNEEVIEFTADTLKFVHRSDDAEEVGNTLSFSNKWDEYYLDLGKTLNMERCKSFAVKVKDQNGLVSYKFYDKDDKELIAFYQKRGNTSLSSSDDGVTRFAVMAHDDDAEYPFTITIESIKIVMDTTPVEEVEKGVEHNIVNLRDSVAETLGDDFLIGTAISYQEFADSMEMELVTKHFNAVTLGNELKPDSILGSGNNNLQKVTLNGVTFDFPTLTYSTPERYLDFFLDWNAKNPDKQIKIRGHVLVWHSQTPTWFFREGYKSNGAYVSPDEMALRQEYYIKSVAEHFTAEDSKYKDLFYGWDVVNEAVSDSRRTYRNASENSEWWAVYNSNRFITDAFVFANKYMNPAVELYYNDYNDTSTGKVDGIEQLLRDVKATPGARIDGFGMQAHYDVNSPTMDAFTNAAKRYAAIVDSVQVTELDFKGSSGPTDEKLAKRYEDVYNAIRRLREEGINFTAMTIWGVVDKHSWLQTSNSVGGAASGNARQYPLLFDNNYKAKNSFWAIVNAGELMPEIHDVVLVKSVDKKFSAGIEYSFKKGDELVTFVPEWTEGKLAVKVMVPDSDVTADDKVTLYVSADGEISTVAALATASVKTDAGYEAVLTADVDSALIKSGKVKLDIVVEDNGKKFAFNDTRLKQDASSDYYAKALAMAAEVVYMGTVEVDGDASDEAWNDATEVVLAINNGAAAEATAKLVWDADYLYVLATVKDAVLDATASADHEKDSIEVFIDENNHKTTAYEDDDKQYRINYLNEQTFNGPKCLAENVKSAVKTVEGGYVIEAAFKWTDIEAKEGTSLGFDIQVNDAENGARVGTLNWADTSGSGWESTAGYGNIVLMEVPAAEEPEEPETPEVPETPEETRPGNSGNSNGNGNANGAANGNGSANSNANNGNGNVNGNNGNGNGNNGNNGNGNNGNGNNGNGNGRGNGRGNAAVETPGVVTEDPVIETPAVEEITAVEEVAAPEAETVETPAEAPAEGTVIAEEETPLAPAITTAAPETGMGIMLKLAIAAAVVAIGGIATCLYVFKFKK